MKITATTSKIVLFVDFLVALTLTALVVVGAYQGKDMSQITTIALAWDGQLAVVVGFYFWKAKNENRSKGVQKLVRDMAEQYGIEGVARIAEIIFKE